MTSTIKTSPKWSIVTPMDRLTQLEDNAKVYNMTIAEYIKHEQWESIEHYINFKEALGWQFQ